MRPMARDVAPAARVITTPVRAIGARARRLAPAAVAALTLLTGCATATGRGQAALYTGQYDEAATRFEEALSDTPDNVTALTGLGIARYRLGAFGEAQRAMTEALRQAPDLPLGHLYLGLIALLGGHDDAARESLRRYAELGAAPRVVAHIDRALRAVAAGGVSPEMRRYVASSIEDQSAWAGELIAARQALAHAELRWLTYEHSLWLTPVCRCR